MKRSEKDLYIKNRRYGDQLMKTILNLTCAVTFFGATFLNVIHHPGVTTGLAFTSGTCFLILALGRE